MLPGPKVGKDRIKEARFLYWPHSDISDLEKANSMKGVQEKKELMGMAEKCFIEVCSGVIFIPYKILTKT